MISLKAIQDAQNRISPYIVHTAMARSESLSAQTGVPVFLKYEHQQVTGAFKFRGATNAVLEQREQALSAGVTTASTGNHGRALAVAAKNIGARAVICMSRLVPENKVRAIRALGAKIEIVGDSQDDAMVRVRALQEEGMLVVPPFDDRHVIAGQGTLGLDVMAQVPHANTILVPLSGGGLIAGVAAAAKAIKPDVKIIGISMTRGAAMHAALQAGQPVDVREEATLADSLGGGIGLHNQYTFKMVQALVDDVVLLDEDEIAAGIAHIYWQEGQVVEGAAAVGVSAIVSGKIRAEGPVVALLTGANIDTGRHFEIIENYKPAR